VGGGPPGEGHRSSGPREGTQSRRDSKTLAALSAKTCGNSLRRAKGFACRQFSACADLSNVEKRRRLHLILHLNKPALAAVPYLEATEPSGPPDADAPGAINANKMERSKAL
jgi:hypothetical protein